MGTRILATCDPQGRLAHTRSTELQPGLEVTLGHTGRPRPAVGGGQLDRRHDRGLALCEDHNATGLGASVEPSRDGGDELTFPHAERRGKPSKPGRLSTTGAAGIPAVSK